VKRPLRPDELKLWAVVAGTVRLAPGRSAPVLPAEPDPSRASTEGPTQQIAAALAPAKARSPAATPPPDDIEPRRRHRLARGRDPIHARLDLHGLDYDAALAALERFVRRAHDEGGRAVLVITGKGRTGDGVLRRFAPEWLAGPTLRPLVAGVSHAERRHGGEGALYVALKRRP